MYSTVRALILLAGIAAVAGADFSVHDCTVLRDENLQTGDSLTLTNDRCWYLSGPVYVDSACTLRIEPGTWIAVEQN